MFEVISTFDTELDTVVVDNNFFWLVCVNAQFNRLEDSFNLDLALLVPLITNVILRLSIIEEADIPHPDFFVKPVLRPSAPVKLFNNLLWN